MGPNEVLDKSIRPVTVTPRFHVVELTDVEEGGLLTDAGGAWIGVAQEGIDELDVANGRHLRIRTLGISACVAGETLAVNDLVVSDANGRVVKGIGRQVGIVLTPGVVGDHVSVFLTPGVVAS